MAATTTVETKLVDEDNSIGATETIVNTANDERTEPIAPATTSSSPATRELNAIELDQPDVEYADTQSIGLEDSGGLFWICNAFVLYGRQMDASSTGLILLLSHGLQFIWALNTMRRHHDRQEQLTMLGEMAILIYYVGAIAGTLAAAALLTTIKKRIIYVGLTIFAFDFGHHLSGRFHFVEYRSWPVSTNICSVHDVRMAPRDPYTRSCFRRHIAWPSLLHHAHTHLRVGIERVPAFRRAQHGIHIWPINSSSGRYQPFLLRFGRPASQCSNHHLPLFHHCLDQ